MNGSDAIQWYRNSSNWIWSTLKVSSEIKLESFMSNDRASIFSRAEPDASAFRLISRRALAHGFRPMIRSSYISGEVLTVLGGETRAS